MSRKQVESIQICVHCGCELKPWWGSRLYIGQLMCRDCINVTSLPKSERRLMIESIGLMLIGALIFLYGVILLIETLLSDL